MISPSFRLVTALLLGYSLSTPLTAQQSGVELTAQPVFPRAAKAQPAYLAEKMNELSPSEGIISQRAKLFELAAAQAGREKAELIIKELDTQLISWDERMKPYLHEAEEYEPLETLGESDKKPDESQVESSKGLYFDTALSQLSYLGQVELRDQRLHLDCQGLYVQLERESTTKSLEEEKELITGTGSKSKESQPPTQKEKEATPTASEQETKPITVVAQLALLDIDKENLLLRGGRDGITIRHSQGELVARGAKTLAIMSESLGAFYLIADEIEGFYKNKDGSLSEISTKGSILFLLSDDSVYLQRNVRIKHEKQLFESAGTMRLQLKPTSPQKAAKPPFASFQKQYNGLVHVTAEDLVELQLAEDKEAQIGATMIQADRFSYDAQTGAIILSGERSEMSQGKQRLIAEGSSLIYWSADGSISVQGDGISGQYERTVTANEQAEPSMVTGEFKTSKQLLFIASDHAFYFPHGLTTEDEYSSLLSKSQLYIPFLQKEIQTDTQPDADEQSAEFRLPPLVFNELGEPEGIYTNSLLDIANRAQPHFALRGNAVELSFAAGLANIRADEGEQAILDYGGRRLEAISTDSSSVIVLNEKGDLDIKATDISMQLPDEQGMQTLHCRNGLFLEREQARILLDEHVLITSPEMKLTTEGKTTLFLREISKEEQEKSKLANKGRLAQHPHLSYPYSGLDRVIMDKDTSIQTADFSLQNEGLLTVHLADEDKRPSHPSMRGIAQLEALDNVRLLMRSPDKRMLYARGGKLVVNGYTGSKTLTGHTVYITDEQSTHQASGNARLHLDANNSVSISGNKQVTRAKNIREQISNQKK